MRAVATSPAAGGGVRHRRGASIVVRQAADAATAATADGDGSADKDAKSTVSQDILAGISTACVAMPQSCAYALLAGTGVKCAVMAAAAASVPCAILGSSRYMQVGCLSLAALLTRGTLTSLGLPGASEVYVMGEGGDGGDGKGRQTRGPGAHTCMMGGTRGRKE